MRSCRADRPAYAVTAAACILLTFVIVCMAILNHLYFVKDWLNKYDHLSMNRPAFMILFEIYIVVRSITDSLPYDDMIIQVYYIKCLIISIYTTGMLFYCLLSVVFQSLHVQR